jgi:hypothetical protein
MSSARRHWLIGGAVVLALAAALALEITATRPVREAVHAYTALIAAANRQDLEAVRRISSQRYLKTHAPRAAEEGGVVGLPRNMHKNFQAWQHGANIWICPTNRVGPLYQFVFEQGAWRFDGPIGILRPRGEVVPVDDLPDAEGSASDDDEIIVPR